MLSSCEDKHGASTSPQLRICVTKQLPSDKRVHLNYSLDDIAAHSARIRNIPPQDR